ncbi:hypothetical protein A1O1_06275 [Capronia coronata CBS 617.96]|uniref:Aminotransferase n=1 Tax=Capronia coronata CBS 617.96 TaxID=1182541 RepID=W9Y9K8_9EURO|nr:uncharacterized protein A1O1_06275 [Capronia coronata CBS 617.96]EXJ85906.1 hypothetical protein A1O1_06275 [Capronia coronata CBS 617.96]
MAETEPAPLLGESTPPPPPSALFHRSLQQQPAKVISAKGIYLTLDTGRVVIDACGGAAVASLGHGNEEVIQAVAEQMKSGVSYVHSLTYTTDAAEELARHLIDGPQGGGRFGLTRAYFVGSGSEAMDSALKLARQYFFELGQRGRTKLVARRQAFHGSTVGAMNVSSNVPRKVPYANFQLDNISWVSPAYAYQYSNWQRGETEEEFAQKLVSSLDNHFQRIGPDKVIAFVAEPLVGATSGCTPAPRGYFKGVREVCDKYSILLILDEVMCGMGRTGTMFAFEQEGIVPDIVTIAKGLGGGYAPIAGMLVHQKVVEVVKKGTSSFNHGHTYQAHPVACAATLAVQRIIARDGMIDNCARMGRVLHALLVETFAQAKYVGDIRGRGLFWGLEFVQDKALRNSFPPGVLFAARFQAIAFELGVAIYPGAGTYNGTRGDHAIVAPPYNITPDELIKIVDTLKLAYDRLEKEIDDSASE